MAIKHSRPNSKINILVIAVLVLGIVSFAVANLLWNRQASEINIVSSNTSANGQVGFASVSGGDLPVLTPAGKACGAITSFKIAAHCGISANFGGATYTCSTMIGTQQVGRIVSKVPTGMLLTACRSVDNLFAEAYKACAANCLTPMPFPPTPSGSPKPPSGCVYKQVQCIKAPCPELLVCPQAN